MRVLRIWRKWWVRLLLVLAVLGVCAGGALWAKGKLERRQSRKLTAMATEYLREGKGEEARMGLQAALRLDPRNAEALRLEARLLLAQGANAEALDALRELTESGQLGFEDLTLYATLAAREGDTALADRLVNSAAAGGNAVLRHLLRAQVKGAANDPAGAEKELREAVALDESGEAGLFLARFLVSRRLNAETAPEVLALLKKLTGRPDQLGAEALVQGLSAGVVPPVELEGWITALRSHPEMNAQGLLLADAVEIRLRPATKAEVVGRMAARLQGKPLAERVQGMTMAMRVGEPQTASSLVEPAEAAGDVGIFSIWLDALGLQNRWAEILEALGREGQPLPEFLRGLYTGRALVAQGKMAEGRRAYGNALEGAFPKREEFLMAVAYLGRVGEDDLFEQGLRKALEDPDGRAEVMRAVVPAVAGRLDATRTRRVYEIAASMPGGGEDMVLRNDMDYLALVVGQPVDVATIAERSRANPRDFALRVTHAMALLRSGNGKQALQELENCEPDVHVATLIPQQKAVVAAALALNGRNQEAQAVAMSIPPMSLSKQEADFLVACLQPKGSPAKKTAPKK